MLAVLSDSDIQKPKIIRRTKQKPNTNLGHGYFKILGNDLVYQFNQRYTYVLSQLSRNVWRYFVFRDDYLVYTERCYTIHVANNKAYTYITSQIASQNKDKNSWSNL